MIDIERPALSNAEWRAVATALQESDAPAEADHSVLKVVRQFTALTRRYRRPAEQCRAALVKAGFNDRQIDALALLSG